MLTLLGVVLAGCGGGEESGTPSPSTSPSEAPTGSTEAIDPGGPPASAGPDELKELLRVALRPLVDRPVIDFRHDVYSGKALAIETKGRAFQHLGWQSTTTSPRQLDSSQPPQGDEIKGSMQVRAVGDALYLQLSTLSLIHI